jgi:hypothetical protein
MADLQIVVQPRHSIWKRTLLLLLLAGLLFGLTLGAFEFGRRWNNPDVVSLESEISVLRGELKRASLQRDEADSRQTEAQSTLSIEQSATAKLGSHLRELEDENARLKADLAFYEQLLPTEAGAAVSIRSADALQETSKGVSEVKFRVLVGQGAKAAKPFNGSLQIVISILNDGKQTRIEWPQKASETPKELALSFRLFQRVQGSVSVPLGATVMDIQLRILDDHAMVVTQQAIKLSR